MDLNILLIIGGTLLGALSSLIIVRINKNYKEELERRKQEILEKGKKEAEELLEKARSQTKEIKKNAQEENKRLEEQLESLKRTLSFKGNLLSKRETRNENITATINRLKTEIRKEKTATDEAKEEIMTKLKNKTKLTSETAKSTILDSFGKKAELTRAKYAQMIEEEIGEDAPVIAKNLLKGVIQRITSPSSVDKNSTAITIKQDRFKGLLIGKQGKNIEYLESLLPDVDIIFNLEPKVIYAGGLNLVNRNIAKKAIEKLQNSTRKPRIQIDHKKIKQAVEAARKEIDKAIIKAGKEAIKEANIKDKIPEELLKLVGRLKFRTSFGQNVLRHSIEMAAAGAILAAEIGADIEKAKTAAFFHDIGKAIDHEVGGSHDQLSKEILEEHNFDPDIVHAAYAHHDAEPQKTPEAMIVKAADAISAGRPGARQESLTSYLERIQKLEEVVQDFEGVKKAYAISAGREVRIIINEEELKDGDMQKVAEGAANKIEEELTYPGKIKVNVIRTIKAVDYAK